MISGAFKLITAVLPLRCDALGVMDGLRRDLGVNASALHLGRGTSRLRMQRSKPRIGDVSAKKVLTTVVAADQADEVFAYVYEKADMGRPHGGVIFQQPLSRSTVYELPDVPVEER